MIAVLPAISRCVDAYLLLCVGRRLGRRITSLCPSRWAGIEALVWACIAGVVVDRVQAAGWGRPVRWALLLSYDAVSSVGALHRPLRAVWAIATSCQRPILVFL